VRRVGRKLEANPCSKGYWRVAGSQILSVALPNTYWDNLGLKALSQTRQRLNQTA
jgi:hypothetical protein